MSIKQKKVATTVSSAIEHAVDELISLGSEMQEAYDGIPDNLQNSDRASALRETAEVLESLDTPESPGCVQDLKFDVVVPYETRVGRETRRLRCESACAYLSGVSAALLKWIEYNDEHTDLDKVEELQEAVDNIVDTAEGCEFPGHRG